MPRVTHCAAECGLLAAFDSGTAGQSRVHIAILTGGIASPRKNIRTSRPLALSRSRTDNGRCSGSGQSPLCLSHCGFHHRYACRRVPAEPSRARPPAASSLEQVDINHASVEELIQVPGLTRSWAERIVRFRPYRSKLDLEQDGVLPGEVYNRIKDYIVAHRDKK